jgi:hypothetical protein
MDRVTKLLLTIIAVALWGLLLKQTPTHVQAAEDSSHTVKAPFSVVDAEGNAILTVQRPKDGPAVQVFGPSGRSKIAFDTTGDDGSVMVFPKRGKGSAGLIATENASSLMVLYPQGKVGVSIEAGEKGALAWMYDVEGEKRVQIVGTKDLAGLMVFGRDSETAVLGANNGQGALEVRDSNGKRHSFPQK